jgi:hypothetical protein
MLDSAPTAVARRRPASLQAVGHAERQIGISFSPSYRTFLATVGPIAIEYEGESTTLLRVYGLTAKASGLPNVVWCYSVSRTAASRNYLNVAEIIGFRPPCGQRVSLSIFQTGSAAAKLRSSRPTEVLTNTRILESTAALGSGFSPRSRPCSLCLVRCGRDESPARAMRSQPKSMGNPARRSTSGQCECGRRSHLKRPIAEPAKDGEAHSANPGAMRAQPSWD